MVSVCSRSHDVENLLRQFSRRAYDATDSDDLIQDIQKKCEDLFAKDYNYRVIDNTNGELLVTYPSRILLLESTKTSNLSDGKGSFVEHENTYDMPELYSLFKKSKNARVRGRFPIPVLLFEGKTVCRSATLAIPIGASSVNATEHVSPTPLSSVPSSKDAGNYDICNDDRSCICPSSESYNDDIQLLKTLSVGCIFDLIIQRKTKKYGIFQYSSEKLDNEKRYSDFTIWGVPYPGSAFFIKYQNKNFCAEDLMFNWKEELHGEDLLLSDDLLISKLGIDFNNYKTWDLIKLTQNYMKLMLTYLMEGTSGILIHCKSGWDRTPLFISLLRMSLWADGRIHSSLTALEMLYLTLAYDWYLFRHKLPDRICKGEEIMHFCFNFLKNLASEDFSVVKRSQDHGAGLHRTGSFRQERLYCIASQFRDIYVAVMGKG